jgi:hypothetical protein
MSTKETTSKPATTAEKIEQAKWFIGLNLAWLLLAALTVWLGMRSYTLTVDSETTTGTVVDIVELGDSDGGSSYSPVIEFTVAGRPYLVTSQNNYSFWTSQIRFPEGKQVEVRYETGDPQNAEVNSLWDIWQETVILGVFTLLAAIGVNIFLVLRRRWKKTG